MTTYRIVIRRTTTEEFEFRVEANTNNEARGKALSALHSTFNKDSDAIIRTATEERFVSTRALSQKEEFPMKHHRPTDDLEPAFVKAIEEAGYIILNTEYAAIALAKGLGLYSQASTTLDALIAAINPPRLPKTWLILAQAGRLQAAIERHRAACQDPNCGAKQEEPA